MSDPFPSAAPNPALRTLRQAEAVYCASATGGAWRVMSGSVRLDVVRKDGTSEFAGIAVAGDIIGAESLIFGQYSFNATAMLPCTLTPWPGAAQQLSSETLLSTLASSERRFAEVVALRGGLARERVKRLIALLSPQEGERRLPSLRDMADITGLRLETVSRALQRLRAAGVIGVSSLRRRGNNHREQVLST